MSWKPYGEFVLGTKVPGDSKAPPTMWYNHLWLKMWGWKMVAVFEANTSEEFITVGFKDFRGNAYYRTKKVKARLFRMRIGHEDCHFFALNSKGEEISLKLLCVVEKSNRDWNHIPLI